MAVVGSVEGVYITYVTERDTSALPEGAGGRVESYVTYRPHMGVEITKVESYYTYVKERDTARLPEGCGGKMEVYVTYMEKPPEPPSPPLTINPPSVYVTYRMHNGVDLKAPEVFTTYRPHDGVDLNELSVYYTYRNDAEWGEGGRLPLGCGGKIEVYITQALSSLVGYLNDYGMERIQGIVLGSDYYPLKKIQSFNNIFFANNTTGDE